MGNIVQKKCLNRERIFLFFICGILLLAKVNFTYAIDCSLPGKCSEIISRLTGAIGAAIDESKNQLYFVDYNEGSLKCINLPLPPSSIPTIVTIATGFSYPEDVQLDLTRGFAYVTTRVGPRKGMTGALWKVNISTGAKNLVAFNLGAPQQLVLDTSNNQAFVVGYDDGKLRRIDLTSGAKTIICGITPATKLGHPVGLAITRDKKYAYVTEQDTKQISKIDLTTGLKDPQPVATGLIEPFFLAWTDNSQNSLYVVERDPANKVKRVDLLTKAKYDVITNLPWRPSGIVVSSIGTHVYVTTDKKIVKVNMVDWDLEERQPVFTRVGHVPATSIINGYATTSEKYFFHVKHSPFGGTLHIFGNLNNFKTLGATHYEVHVSKDGGEFVPLNLSWNMYKWNPETLKQELVSVAPVAGTTRYRIPDEYPLNATWWCHPFLLIQWPSGENGLYTFKVQIYSGTTSTSPLNLPEDSNSLTLMIDNTPPNVEILSIWQKGLPNKEIKSCDIVSTGTNAYYFKITAHDPNHHLLNYKLIALWGDNKTEEIYSDKYDNHLDPDAPHWWSGVSNWEVPRSSAGNRTTSWQAKCNCAHTFYLESWKRTIDGYNYIFYKTYHKSITINNTGTPCR